jgi:hypothetical protein
LKQEAMALKQDWSVGTRWQVGAGLSARRDEMRDGEVHRHLAKVVNLQKVVDSGPPPSVAISSPGGGFQAAPDLVEVTPAVE